MTTELAISILRNHHPATADAIIAAIRRTEPIPRTLYREPLRLGEWDDGKMDGTYSILRWSNGTTACRCYKMGDGLWSIGEPKRYKTRSSAKRAAIRPLLKMCAESWGTQC